jgi:hypothetical protein
VITVAAAVLRMAVTFTGAALVGLAFGGVPGSMDVVCSGAGGTGATAVPATLTDSGAGSDEARSDEARADEAGSDETGAVLTGSDEGAEDDVPTPGSADPADCDRA